MSLKPKFAERILDNSKQIEIRKRFSAKWIGARAVLYSTHPVSAIVGEGRINSVISGPPSEIWSAFSSQIGCSRAEYDSYVGGSGEVYAIRLMDVNTYACATTLRELSTLVSCQLRAPQSFFNLAQAENGRWTMATWLAGFLAGEAYETAPGYRRESGAVWKGQL